MAKVIVMPKLGLTMTEGTVSKWLKKTRYLRVPFSRWKLIN